jgi:hypothetical protein
VAGRPPGSGCRLARRLNGFGSGQGAKKALPTAGLAASTVDGCTTTRLTDSRLVLNRLLQSTSCGVSRR